MWKNINFLHPHSCEGSMLALNSPMTYSGLNGSFSNRKGAAYSAVPTTKFIKPLMQDSFSKINFKGYMPSAQNAKGIEEICRLARNLAESSFLGRKPRFAIVAHSTPDADALFSPIALKHIIQEAVGVDSDVIVMKSAQEKFKRLVEKGDIIVVQEKLGENADAEKIREHFGDYDVVFCLDTAKRALFDREIYEGIVKNASNVVKIDHHLVDSMHLGEFNYGHSAVVDTSQQSTGQLLMQFIDALGIKKAGDKFKRIVELIYTTIQGDTNLLQYADKGVAQDLELLNPNLNDIAKARIIKQLQYKTPAEKRAMNSLSENMRAVSGNRRVVYSVLDASDTNLSIDEVKALMGIAADGMLAANGAHYSIVVGKHPKAGVFASIRSQDGGNAPEIARLLGGGGRPNTGAIPFSENMPLEEAVEKILQQIELSHPAEQSIAC